MARQAADHAVSEGQMSDYKGAALMLNALPRAKELLGDKGYDADWFRHALAKRGITACIRSKSNRKAPIEHDPASIVSVIRSKCWRLKDWRRIHTRYDRCAHTYVCNLHRGCRHLLAVIDEL